MNLDNPLSRRTQMDRTTFPEWRDQILSFESQVNSIQPRSYPGYPRWPLTRVAPRAWPSLDRVLARRRSANIFAAAMPSRRTLSRLLLFAHGVNASRARGPTPSAGGLQALELYLVVFKASWLPSGLFHYDRADHQLSQIASPTSRADWRASVPSLETLQGGAVLFVLVGDEAAVTAKYGDQAHRLLLLEAGHLAQNLCLLAISLGLCGVPLGGFYEREILRAFVLPDRDVVLGLVLCGKPERPG